MGTRDNCFYIASSELHLLNCRKGVSDGSKFPEHREVLVLNINTFKLGFKYVTGLALKMYWRPINLTLKKRSSGIVDFVHFTLNN